MIDIFLGTRVLHLTDKPSDYNIEYKDRQQLKDLIGKFTEGYYTEIYIYHHDLDELFKNFKIFFNYIEAAGGLVFNKYGQILFIRRNSLWDLPKGKIEKGETPQEAALREVSEECGIDDMAIIKRLPDTYHIFNRGGKENLKKTYWFKILYHGSKEPTPLREEGITETRWVNPEDISYIMEHTHPNLLPIIKLAY